jgi:hypothetical protein
MSDILQALLDSGALYLALGAILCIKRDLRSSYLLAYCTRLGQCVLSRTDCLAVGSNGRGHAKSPGRADRTYERTPGNE